MDRSAVTKAITHTPATPGIYTWRGLRGRVLYVGKAVNLKSRLSSYTKTKDSRIIAMVTEARAIEWETVPTDIEALILESQRIKQLKPKYNIVLRDDKQYASVGITDEPFPHVLITRQATRSRSAAPFKQLIGPFTDAGALQTTLRWLRKIFPYCTCKQTHHVRCLNAHMDLCMGFCCLKEASTKEERSAYAKNIRGIINILTGKRATLITREERRMKLLAKHGKLEEARDLQKRIERIRHVFENAQIVAGRQRSTRHPASALEALAQELQLTSAPQRIEGYDVAHIQGEHPSGAMVVFTDGNPDTTQYRLFNLKSGAAGDTDQLHEVLTRRLQHPEWPLPNLILVDGGKAQLNTIVRVLDAHNLDIPVIALTKDDHHRADHLLSSLDSRIRMLASITHTARDLVTHIDKEAHRFAIGHYRRRHATTLRK